MKFIDLHCDTILRIQENPIDFEKEKSMHITLPGMIEANMELQVFAICIVSMNSTKGLFERGMKSVESVHELVNKINQLSLVLKADDFQTINETKNKIGVLIALEGAAPLEGDAEKIKTFYDRGVRLLTIAWSDNEFSGTVFGSGSGLTNQGRILVELCEELGIIIDVSHISDQGFLDLLPITKKPFIASHSNARAICPNPRNLTDEMIKAIADKGGLIGLMFGSSFLSPISYEQEKEYRDLFMAAFDLEGKAKEEAIQKRNEVLKKIPRPSLDWLLKHVKHIVDKGGENVLGFGSDFDGIPTMPVGLDGVQSLPAIANLLSDGGLSSEIVEKICWKNSERVLKELLG